MICCTSAHHRGRPATYEMLYAIPQSSSAYDSVVGQIWHPYCTDCANMFAQAGSVVIALRPA